MTALKNDTTRATILEAVRIMRDGPRSKLSAILEQLSGTEARTLVREAIDASDHARHADALGNDLEAQEHEARFAAYVEALEELAGELEPEGWDAMDDRARTAEHELADAGLELAKAQNRMRWARREIERVSEALGYYGDRGELERELATSTIRRLRAGAETIGGDR
jgi:hypothetical protein